MVWYVPDIPRQRAAPAKKQANAKTSDGAAESYLGLITVYKTAATLENTTAPTKWEYMLTVSLCKYPKLAKDFLKDDDGGRYPE
jgi:hypothetical protein